jgi:hypothetical protein
MRMKEKHRRLARERYWEENDRDSYNCPDCGRTEEGIEGSFEVHHINGEPLDNRVENHVALCRLCHNLREDKKPSVKSIEKLRDFVHENDRSAQSGDKWKKLEQNYLEIADSAKAGLRSSGYHAKFEFGELVSPDFYGLSRSEMIYLEIGRWDGATWLYKQLGGSLPTDK